MSIYAEDIKVVATAEAIRQRASSYIGSLDNPMLINRLVQESLCIAVDEAMSGRCTEIRVSTQRNGQITVRDNGPGLPVSTPVAGKPLAELLLTQLFACREHKQNQQVRTSCCQAGLVVTNALSEWLIAGNSREGACWVQEYRRGEPLAPFRREFETSETGFELTFLPDSQIVGASRFDAIELAKWMRGLGLQIAAINISYGESASGEAASVLFKTVGPENSHSTM